VAVAFAALSCGRPAPDARAADLAEARRTATAAADRVAVLERRVNAVGRTLQRARTRYGRLQDRLQDTAARLRASLDHVRTAAAASGATAESATADAASAVVRVRQLARRLAVLESRYDLHVSQEAQR
jgi:hypothetical protein